MLKRIVSGMMLTLLLIGMLTFAFKIQPVKGEPTTWTVDDDGPADFHIIQEAVNAASDGDTIFVRNGTYQEHVVVNKIVSLVGENRSFTVIDGNGTGTVVTITKDNVNITGFTVQNSGGPSEAGILLNNENYYCNITKNTITNNYYGILSWAGCVPPYSFSYNFISENIITNNNIGIDLYYSSYNTVSGNTVTNNDMGISLCSNNFVCANNITNNWEGISAGSNNTMVDNNMANNYCGIHLGSSSYNFISGNNITNNEFGTFIYNSPNNEYYHNNFIDNTQYDIRSSTNFYCNYWSDYQEKYPDAAEIDDSGIWDIPYIIDSDNIDYFPLMEPWTPVADTRPPIITVLSPENKTYTRMSVPLIFAVSEPYSWLGYSLDGQENVTISENTIITGLVEGKHSLIIYANDTVGHMGCSDVIHFAVVTFPSITVTLPTNGTRYYTANIPLHFTVNETTSWIGYSLDNQANVTITGNTTLAGLSEEAHSITVYANDTAGNMGASDTVYFTVALPYGPTAEFTVAPETAKVDESVKFDASASLPGWNGTHEMPITEYCWGFGDGNQTSTSIPTVYHSFSSSGIYYVTLTVYALGAAPETDSTTHKITVISIPVGGYSFPIKGLKTTKPLTLYLALATILTSVFTMIKRKIYRKTKHPRRP